MAVFACARCKLNVKYTHCKAVKCIINMPETKENKDQPLHTLLATKSLSKKDNQIQAPSGKLFSGTCPTQPFTMRLENMLFSFQILKKTLYLTVEIPSRWKAASGNTFFFSSTGVSHTFNSISIFLIQSKIFS